MWAFSLELPDYRILITCGVAALLWYTKVHIPVGFSEPLRFRFRLAVRELFLLFYWTLHLLNILPYEEGLRRFGKPKQLRVPDNISIEEETFDGIQVRLYKRKGHARDGKDSRPGLVVYHSGGWIFLSPKTYDTFVLGVLDKLDMFVVSVQYRLSPESTFPGPLMDCYNATKYFLTNAQEYGVDPHRISIFGDSAGGNMAVGVSRKLRDEKFSPMPKSLMLICPVAQALDFSLPSYVQNKYAPVLSRHLLLYMISMYACGSGKYVSAFEKNMHLTPEAKRRLGATYIRHDKVFPSNRVSPYQPPELNVGDESAWNELKHILEDPFFSPLVAPDLSGLPDTYVYTAQYDVLRDEGQLLADRLREAGVNVVHVNGSKGFHGMTLGPMPRMYEETRSLLAELIQYLGEHAM